MGDAVDFLDKFNVRRASDVTIRFTVTAASAPGAEPPAKRQRCDAAGTEQQQPQDQDQDREQEQEQEQEQGGQPDGRQPSQERLRRVVREIYGHSVILTKASEWAERMLSPEWSAETPGVLDVELDDEGEVTAAELLFKSMYSTADAGRPLKGADQATLLQVLLLADRLRAERALSAAVNVLIATAGTGTADVLDWDTVHALYTLPLAVAKSKALKPLRRAAAAALQHRLGDLDAAWLDAARRAQLLALPFEAVRQLVRDERTRVSSENTVVYTIAAWIDAAGGDGCGAMQRAALAKHVRAPHLSSLYCATAGSRLLTSWLPDISGADVHFAALFQEVDDGSMLQTRLLRAKGLSLARRSAWRLLPRAPSSVTEANVEWRLPLSEMRQLYERAAAAAAGSNPIEARSEAVVFQGCVWDARVRPRKGKAGVVLDAHLHLRLPPGCGAASVLTALVGVEPRPQLADDAVTPLLRFTTWVFEAGSRQGRADAFGLGELKEWDEVVWRNKGLLGLDGRVGLRYTIKCIV